MNSPRDTIVAPATPVGESGLGVIRLSGAEALAIASRLFQARKPIDWAAVPSHSCHVGKLAELDQAVATLFRAPHSYTGEDVVELSLHGSPYVLQQAVRKCLAAGARLAAPGEFTERAFLYGKIDLTQAEAVAELIGSRTEKTRAAAVAQLEGRLAARVRGLRDELLPLLAHIEVGLDHSDEHHDFLAPEALRCACLKAEAHIAEVLASAQVGKILRDGLRVALVGRPNVGKSSLLNALLKEERAIVTPVAGTTRDTLNESVDWNGLQVTLTDTAGLRRSAQDPVERLGIERTRRAVEQADLVIGLFDGAEALTDEDRAVVGACAAKPHVWAVNKSDLPARWPAAELQAMNGGSPVIVLSARTGDGLAELVDAVKGLALQGAAGAAQAEWLLNERHRAALERAAQALERARAAAEGEAFEECVALELQTALRALGEIIGETVTEELLGQIFSRFCVGK